MKRKKEASNHGQSNHIFSIDTRVCFLPQHESIQRPQPINHEMGHQQTLKEQGL